MKNLTFGQNLEFQHEYWRYLSSEQCDCDEAKHVHCHSQMQKELRRLDDWQFTPGLLPKIEERMVAFSAFTQSPDMKAYANSAATRARFLLTHRMEALPAPKTVKKAPLKLA